MQNQNVDKKTRTHVSVLLSCYASRKPIFSMQVELEATLFEYFNCLTIMKDKTRGPGCMKKAVLPLELCFPYCTLKTIHSRKFRNIYPFPTGTESNITNSNVMDSCLNRIHALN